MPKWRKSKIYLPKKAKKAAVFVAGGKLVLGDDFEAEPDGFVQFAGWVVLKAVTEFETAEQIASAVAVQIVSTLRVSPTRGSFQWTLVPKVKWNINNTTATQILTYPTFTSHTIIVVFEALGRYVLCPITFRILAYCRYSRRSRCVWRHICSRCSHASAGHGLCSSPSPLRLQE